MYLRGEDINIGVGVEDPTTRGTVVAPQSWIPGRTPTGIKSIVEKVDIKETRSTGIDTSGSEIVQKRVEGDLEFNIRNNSIGYLLKSLLGKVTTTVVDAGETWSHLFEVLPQDPQHPSLTIGLSQPNIVDYDYPLGIVKSLEVKTPVDDLVNATVNVIASSEAEHTPVFEPTFASNDYSFRHQDVTIKIADDVAGLAGASALSVKEFSFSDDNNSRVNQNIGELNPSDIISNLLSSKITLKCDYKDAVAWHDLFKSGEYKAMSVKMERSDVTIGTTSNPSAEVVFPKVSIGDWTPDRPIDDIVTEGVEIKVHYDDTEAEAIHITLVNETESYDHI